MSAPLDQNVQFHGVYRCVYVLAVTLTVVCRDRACSLMPSESDTGKLGSDLDDC